LRRRRPCRRPAGAAAPHLLPAPSPPPPACPTLAPASPQLLAGFGDDADAFRHYAPLVCRASDRAPLRDGKRLYRDTLRRVGGRASPQAFVVVRDIGLFGSYLQGPTRPAGGIPSTPTSAGGSRGAVSFTRESGRAPHTQLLLHVPTRPLPPLPLHLKPALPLPKPPIPLSDSPCRCVCAGGCHRDAIKHGALPRAAKPPAC
jgi:hypothetical protein